ncbi:hypothetical protein [Pedobacter faecalis]|uniref:hypothetical protein n=1 Tax=Pedobacter faecalis TaxID=3041495 RepID=UPI00254D1FF6|nr:hypothetical protein [Pedobacter sp. ELA7]
MSKYLILSVIVLGLVSPHARSQSNIQGVFRVSSAEHSSSKLFKSFPLVTHLSVEYWNDTPRVVKVYRRRPGDKFERLDEQFHLAFGGDMFLFQKKYAGFEFTNPKMLRERYANKSKCFREGLPYRLTTTIRRDSSTHVFEFYKASGTHHMSGPVQPRPVLKDNLTKLTAALHQILQDNSIQPCDSNLLITGVVKKDGSISGLRVVEANETSCINRIIKILEATRWRPKISNGRLMESTVKIFVQSGIDRAVKIWYF